MDYLIDIQSLRAGSSKYIPKEVGVVALQKFSISHWIVAPPCDFSSLSLSAQRRNTHRATDIHGLNWFEGCTSIHRVNNYLHEIAISVSKIYVRGFEESNRVENVIGRNVVNLENFRSPSLTTLEGKFKYVGEYNQNNRRSTTFVLKDRCAMH